ncbi:MAG: DUF4349 domain-containing protein [Anaerolineae bacterium]|jgi:hypothetical protein
MKQPRALSLVLTLILIAGTLMSCGAAAPRVANQAVTADSAAGSAAPAAPAPSTASVPMEAPRQPEMERDSYALATEERKIIRTGEIVGRFEDVQGAVAEIQARVQGAGGYVVTSNVYANGDDLNASMSVRVPAEQFDRMMEDLAGLAVKVERTSTSGDDVTEEYFDLESRLKALRATEAQLLLLLEDVREKMETAEDILAVYRELQNIQSQIEQYEGRRQFLDRMVDMSTIHLTLLAVEPATPVISGTWNPGATLRSALRALTDTGQFLLDAVIWGIFYLLPVLAILLVPLVLLFIGVRALVRNRAARRASQGQGGQAQPT